MNGVDKKSRSEPWSAVQITHQWPYLNGGFVKSPLLLGDIDEQLYPI